MPIRSLMSSDDSDDDVDDVMHSFRTAKNTTSERSTFANEFSAFGLTMLSQTARARGREIEQQVEHEMAQEKEMESEEVARKRNTGELVVRRSIENNKNVVDRAYANWLTEQLDKETDI